MDFFGLIVSSKPPLQSMLLQEFNSMDENMTEHLVNVQQQALQLAMIVQRIEDGQNSAAGQSGEQECGNLFLAS